MRCLLLDPEDDPLSPAWPRARWDRVIDLGIAGPATYHAWEKTLGCEVEAYPSLDQADFAKLRRVFDFGLGHVVDQVGIDWWDLISLRWLDQFVQTLLVSKLLARLGESGEIFVSSGRDIRLLELLAPGRVRRLEEHRSGQLRRRVASLARLRFRQVLEIAGDKYDGQYKLRRLVAPRRAGCPEPVILLPSAYGNASRTALAFASSLPDLNFLLIATRPSAWTSSVPPGVTRSHLASYADSRSRELEIQGLLSAWGRLCVKLEEQPELRNLCEVGCFELMPAHLREGLAIRDCWLNVFEAEPVAAVLAADEKNPYTRIPVVLARRRGIPALACHHGALDGRYLFTSICADRFLAKGPMEWDYMVRVCGVPEEKVSVASPQAPCGKHWEMEKTKKRIVFFSEPYEASNCRARGVYAEVLPALARLAGDNNCELVIKLHPFESVRERTRLVNDVIPAPTRGVVRVVAEPLSDELMQNAWFSATVSSTAAVDCAMKGVPAVLCTWLDRYGFGYADQFAKFDVAVSLHRADQLMEIPSLLESFRPANPQHICEVAPPEVLRGLLLPNSRSASTADEAIQPERLWA